jgi:hypothetical protein
MAMSPTGAAVQESEPNDSRVTSGELSLVQDPEGSGLLLAVGQGSQDPIASGNYWADPDYWRLSLQAGDIVSISVDTPDSELTPYVELRDAADRGMTSNYLSGSDRDAFISHYVVPATNTYFLRLGRYPYEGTGGAYDLRVEVARGIQQESDAEYSNDSTGGANVLTLAGEGGHRRATVTGTVIAPQGSNLDEDYFNLGLFNAGNVVELTTRLPGGSTLIPKVTLLNASGQVIADEDGDAADGHVRATLSADGTIYVRLEALAGAGSHGQYLLDVDVADPVPPRVTGLSGLPAEGATVAEPIGPTVNLGFSEVLDAATVLGTQGVWRYGGHTYTLTPRSMSWTEAEAEAQRLGGHLVAIDDAAEQEWVSQTFGGWGGWYFWIGATDQVQEGTWKWADGGAIGYSNWGPNQPQSYSSYDYGYLTWNGRWYVTDNTGLGTGGWGLIEIAEEGPDSDTDGLPDVLDPYPANAANAFDLREAGADASFGTADDVLYTLRQTAFSGTGVSLRINEGSLGPGSYRFSVTSTLKDIPGNALDGNGDGAGGDAYVRTFTIAPPPAGYQYEHSGFGPQAPLLELTEDPAGSGLAIGRALGRLDPAISGDYSDLDEWRIELEQGDRVSVSVDSPAGTLYPWIYLYDPQGNHNGQYDQSGYGPDSDAFISNYQVQSSGTYTLVLTKNYSVGEYRGPYELHVERARGIQQEYDLNYANDSTGGANTLTLTTAAGHRTATIAGTIMAAEGSNTDEDTFSLGLFNAGNVVELATRLSSDGTLVPKVTLLNASGQVIADEDGDASDGHVRATLASDGVIYARVEVLSGAGAHGQYLLDVDVADPVPPRITGLSGLPAEGATVAEPIGPTITFGFSEVLDAATVLGTPGVWRYGGHTYTLTPRSMSWTEAEAEAQRLGGHLVTIDDAAEQAWVAETFGGWGGWYFWIGATDQVQEGTWKWADGGAIGYSNWGPNQPQSYSSYDYGYLTWNGRWYVTDNTGLGTGGWGLIEIAEEGPDSDTDGLPDRLDPYPDDAANAFALRAAGADGTFDTADDSLYSLRQVSFSGTGVELRINEGSLGPGSYRFSVTPTLKDIPGNALDGNSDGVGGDAYVRSFIIAPPPAGYSYEQSGVGPQAPLLALTEDPAGSGLAIGRALGRLDPGYSNTYSDFDEWRIELEQGDRVSISVDTFAASAAYPWIYLYDPSGNQVSYDQNFYGPNSGAFISAAQAPTTGTYTLVVTRYYYNDARGPYDLHVERARGIQQESDAEYGNDSLGGANTLTLAAAEGRRTATVAGTVMATQSWYGSANSDEDYFNLGTVSAGESILLAIRTPQDGTLKPILEVYDSKGGIVSFVPNPSAGVARIDITQTIVSPTYYARVIADSGAGSRGQYLLDVAIWPTTELDFADLAVTDVTGPVSADSGETVHLEWTVGNYGTATASAPSGWRDLIVLSVDDRLGNADDVVLSSVQRTDALLVGEEYRGQTDVRIPFGIANAYYVFVKTDQDNAIFENLFEVNNIGRSAGTIAIAGADLFVSSIEAPDAALSGDTIGLSWTVTNAGAPTDLINWTDRVLLSRDDIADPSDLVLASVTHTGGLARDGSYSVERTVTLPKGIEAPYHLIVVTDALKTVYEGTEEDNNSTASSIAVRLPDGVAYWDGGGNGSIWSDPVNWVGDRLPVAGDDVTIDVPGNQSLVHDTGDTNIRKLVSAEALTLSGGSLSVTETIKVSNSLTLAGGTLTDATILPGDGGQGVAVAAGARVTLDGVRLQTGLSIGDEALVTVTGGLTLGGTVIDLLDAPGGGGTGLLFEGAQTLGGTGEVRFGGTADLNLVGVSGGLLTVAPGITIKGTRGGEIGGAGESLRLDGKLIAESAGRTIRVVGGLENRGVLEAKGGGDLLVDVDLVNSGTVQAGADGTISVTGDFTNAPLGSVNITVLGDLPQQHGQIDIGGTAHLGGTIGFTLGSGVVPGVALGLPVFGFGARDGSFASVLGVDVPRGNNGVMLNGAGFSSGFVGNAFSFDGADDGLQLPLVMSYANGATFELWIKTNDDGGIIISDGGGASGGHRGMGLFLETDGKLYFCSHNNGSRSFALYGPVINDGKFHHIAASWTGDTSAGGALLYVDGELVGTGTASSTFATGSTPLYVGGHATLGHLKLGGLIDEIGVYGRALTADEIRAIYAAGSAGKGTSPDSPPPAGLVGWWSGDWGPNDFVSAFQFATEYDDGAMRLVTRQRELPDLQSTSVSAPAAAQSGDYIVVYWDVLNAGLDTGNVSWTDRVVLSEDAVLDAGDVELGRVTHQGGLPSGESYRDAGVYVLPIDTAGDLTLFVTADSGYGVFEGLNEANNSGRTAQPIHVTLRPVPNLQVTEIDLPAEGQPDERVRLSWSVTNSGEGVAIGPWVDQVYLSADGSLTGATLLASVQHDGGMVPGMRYEAFADVTLPRVADGAYRILVSTDATKRVHERFDEGDNLTISAGTIDLRHPDLQVAAISAPDEQQVGYPVQVPVTWTVTNAGERPTIPGAWQDEVYLSQNAAIGDADDVRVGTFLHNGVLAPGESYTQTRTVSLPAGVKGQHYLYVTADAGGHVYEDGQEGNNRSVVEPVDCFTAYADLAVDLVEVPAAGGTSGRPVQLSWKVSNIGIHEASTGTWSDAVYLSADDVLDGADTLLGTFSHSGSVPVGASYTGRATPVLPNGIEGPFHIIVVADSGSVVYEDGRRGDNAGSRALEVAPSPAPDLQVDPGISLPSEGQPDRSVAVSWTVTNSGAGDAEGSWVERVYLSADGTLTGATLLAEVRHDGGLAVGASYSQTANVTLPRVGDGSYRIAIVTDAAGAIYEGKAGSVPESNNLTASGSIIDLRHADLQVVQLAVPEGLIQGFPVRLPISWTVTNAGERGSLSTTWSDQVILSGNAVLGDGDDQAVGSFVHFGSLPAGESYSRGETVTLPIGVNGDYWVFVRTDAQGQVYEGTDEANNASAATAVSLLTPFSDLVVDAVVAPTEALGRDTIQVSWTVRNQGEDATHAQTWLERIVLSADGTLDGQDLELGRITHVGDLAPGETYSEQGSFTLSERLQGSYRVFVVTDAAGAVYEDGFEGNNTGLAGDLLTVSTPLTPNLRVTRVAGPATGQSGDFAHVTWTVTNDGAIPARGGWTDSLYLSVNGAVEGSPLATVRHETPVGLNNVYTAFADIALPDRADDSYHFVVVTDAGDAIYEGPAGEADNVGASQGTLAISHPDLIVTSVVEERLLVTAGDRIDVRWTVRNAGSGDAKGSWSDYLYLSDDLTLDGGDRLLATLPRSGPLAVGDSYSAQAQAVVPADILNVPAKELYLLVKTDAGGSLKEYQAEGNNERDRKLVVLMPPFADLMTSNVTVDKALAIGDPAQITLSWTVSNVGIAQGLTDQWVDQILAGDQVVASFTHQGALEVGQSYTRTETILLPAAMQGRFAMSVRTDALGQVFENQAEANNRASAIGTVDVMPTGYADLQVTAVEAEDGQSGKTVLVSWTVANRGISSTSSAEWGDRLILAHNPDGSGQIRDYGTFGHLGVLAPDGSYTRHAEITLPEGLSGDVYAVVSTGGPFEFLYTDNNQGVAPVRVTLSPSPDLQVADIQATGTVQDGGLIDVTWTVENQGQGDALGSWTDLVVLRPVGNPAASSITLGYFTYSAPLAAGKHYTRTEQFRLPERITGTYQVVVSTNNSRSLYEHGVLGNNNVATDESAVTVSLRPRADLQTAVLEVPERVTAGGTLSARFEVVNQGTTETTVPHWQDRVYLSLDNRPSGDDILIGTFQNGSALAPGERYATETGGVVVPVRYRGDVYVIAVADSGDAVDEYPNDGNNVRVESVYVEPRAFGDLVTSNVVAPTRAQEGSQLEVRYTVTNKGSAPSYASQWHDTVWLTNDKRRPSSANGAILLGTFAHNGALDVGEGYDNSVQVTLPSNLAVGINTYYVTVWSDAYDVVLEDTLSSNTNPDDPNEIDNNNYKARAVQVIVTDEPLPEAEPVLLSDLTVTSVVPAAAGTGGELFAVQWTVQNAGEGTASGGWTDHVYLSSTPSLAFSDPNRVYLGAVAHGDPLASGSSYTTEHSFQLSPPAAGTYVIVVADAAGGSRGQVIEAAEDNNALSGDTLVVPRAPADLVVTSVVTPRQNFSGEPTTIQWTVSNIGESVWSGTSYWVDQVWLSPDPVFDRNSKFYRDRAVKVGDFAHGNGPALAAGGSYTQSAEVSLPAGIQQSWFAHVYVDLDGGLTGGDFERRAYEVPSSNYAKQTVPVTYREPDLEISGLAGPAAGTSGQPISLEWTTANIGTRDTRQAQWSDSVYLSRDPSLDWGDVLLSSVGHAGSLAAGSAYTGQATVTLPEGIEGSYYLLVAADRGNQVPEFQDEGNNLAVHALTISLQQPPNLRVTAVTVPEHAIVGQSVALTYQVTNVGTGATPPSQLRIPGQGGHRFHGKTDMDSTPRRPALPREGGR